MSIKKRNKTELTYGRSILSNGWFGFLPRLKNKLLTRIQYIILKNFGNHTDGNKTTKIFSTLARRIIGSYIYSIKLEVNNACNLSCKMCYVPRDNKELPIEHIISLFRQIKSCGIRIEILGGEPLLRKDIVEIIKAAKEVAHSPFVSIYTNGIFATPEISTGLKAAGLDAALVTLISSDKSIHDEFTEVNGSWEKTIAGIKNLSAANIETYTFTAIHRTNADQIIQIHEFTKNILKVHPLFYQYIPISNHDPLMLDKETWYSLKNLVLSNNPDHSRFVRDFYMLTGNACSGGNFVLTVKVDGSVQPCPFILNLSLGEIHKTSIWKIYINRYNKTRLKEFKCLPQSCSNCTFASVCGGGCRAGNDILFGGYSYADHRCKGPYHEPLSKEKVMEYTPCFF